MASTGLLVISNLRNIFKVLSSARDHVNSILYVDLNLLPRRPLPHWNRTIADIYMHTSKTCPSMDVRVLVASLRSCDARALSSKIDVLLLDQHLPRAVERIRCLYKINTMPTYLTTDCENANASENKSEIKMDNVKDNLDNVYDTVVLGGTFDRLHAGHKILLGEAVLRARKRMVVGVTAPKMLASKKLNELIAPLEERIKNVREFLEDIDNTLNYEIVAIEDFMGPTRTDNDMDLLVVSAETYRGGQKINEIRVASGMKPLDIYTIPLYEDEVDDDDKEKKLSSSNYRMDILGIRLRDPEPRPDLPKTPYVVGLTGGIASGKSVMAKRFERRGAKIINCDLLAHQIYEPGTECYQKLIQHFGNEIINDDKSINRKHLGEIVFSDAKKLEELNQIVWPAVLKEVKVLIDKYRKEGARVVIVEAALLLRAGWEKECHEVWSMVIPPEEAVKRLMARNQFSEEEAKKRVDAQISPVHMVDKSTVVFSSLWSQSFSDKQASRAWDLLTRELGL